MPFSIHTSQVTLQYCKSEQFIAKGTKIAVLLSGDVLSIEYREGGESQRVEVTSGQVRRDEPTKRLHRAVNVGRQLYEQVTICARLSGRGASAHFGIALLRGV
jgi:hypothetical protein